MQNPRVSKGLPVSGVTPCHARGSAWPNRHKIHYYFYASSNTRRPGHLIEQWRNARPTSWQPVRVLLENETLEELQGLESRGSSIRRNDGAIKSYKQRRDAAGDLKQSSESTVKINSDCQYMRRVSEIHPNLQTVIKQNAFAGSRRSNVPGASQTTR